MSRYEYADGEKEINVVLANQDAQLDSISMPNMDCAEEAIASGEALLASLGYDVSAADELSRRAEFSHQREGRRLAIPSWEDTLEDALQKRCDKCRARRSLH